MIPTSGGSGITHKYLRETVCLCNMRDPSEKLAETERTYVYYVGIQTAALTCAQGIPGRRGSDMCTGNTMETRL
jgi:hypothetical protein